MPQATDTSRPELGIRLEGKKSSYSPGDTIIGCVYRKTHAVSPESNISISLSGRTETTVVIKSSQGPIITSSSHGSRFNLIPQTGNSQTIFEGPLHVQGNGEEKAWPFAINLPKFVNPKSLNAGGQEESYLPIDRRDHVLPPTYTLHTSGQTEAFVEYVLTATLTLTGQGRTDTPVATLPFRVLSMGLDPPIADFALERSSCRLNVSAYRLIPGMGEVKLSFSQKIKQSLQTPSVPEFYFNLHVDVPTIVQLDNQTPIPFKLQADPDWTRTSEVIRDVPQKLKLVWLHIRLITQTDFMGKGPTTKSSTVDLCITNAINALRTSLYIPNKDNGPPLDIGQLINLRLGCFTAGFPYPLRRNACSPSFTTYNIRCAHILQWELRGEIMGKHVDAAGTVPLTILAPPVTSGHADTDSMAGPSRAQRSESSIQPSDEEQAPPSFAKVQKEDSKVPKMEEPYV